MEPESKQFGLDLFEDFQFYVDLLEHAEGKRFIIIDRTYTDCKDYDKAFSHGPANHSLNGSLIPYIGYLDSPIKESLQPYIPLLKQFGYSSHVSMGAMPESWDMLDVTNEYFEWKDMLPDDEPSEEQSLHHPHPVDWIFRRVNELGFLAHIDNLDSYGVASLFMPYGSKCEEIALEYLEKKRKANMRLLMRKLGLPEVCDW
ncbi:MAG: hypothetical protein HQL53_10415 [Magnetococcales bacterium]|nr:hypothetical protein [Magnetococcales bacterium]